MSAEVVLYQKERAAFLRVEECGSSIRWSVLAAMQPVEYGDKKGQLEPRLHTALYLTDCDRQVSWALCERADLKKLDRAIEELKACRKALSKAIDKLEEQGWEG